MLVTHAHSPACRVSGSPPLATFSGRYHAALVVMDRGSSVTAARSASLPSSLASLGGMPLETMLFGHTGGGRRRGGWGGSGRGAAADRGGAAQEPQVLRGVAPAQVAGAAGGCALGGGAGPCHQVRLPVTLVGARQPGNAPPLACMEGAAPCAPYCSCRQGYQHAAAPALLAGLESAWTDHRGSPVLGMPRVTRKGVPVTWELSSRSAGAGLQEGRGCRNRLLAADPRNFHGWAYRRHVAGLAGIPPADEEQYATDCINANFSNYSAWHARESPPLVKSAAPPPGPPHRLHPCCIVLCSLPVNTCLLDTPLACYALTAVWPACARCTCKLGVSLESSVPAPAKWEMRRV